jgi:hypothetical protein
LVSAGVGEVNTGSVVELFPSADAMLGLVSVVSEGKTGSGFGVIGALWASRGISVVAVSPLTMFTRNANTIITTTTTLITIITAITKKTTIAIVVALMSIVVVVVVVLLAVFIVDVTVFVVVVVVVIVEVVAVFMVEVTAFVVALVVEVVVQTGDDIDPEEPVNMLT